MERARWQWVSSQMEVASPGSSQKISDHEFHHHKPMSLSKFHKLPRAKEVWGTLYDTQINLKTCFNHFLWFTHFSTPIHQDVFLRVKQGWRNVVETNRHCLNSFQERMPVLYLNGKKPPCSRAYPTQSGLYSMTDAGRGWKTQEFWPRISLMGYLIF